MELLKEGLEIVIIGAPNTGKSSLMNYLSGKERAIVANTPGTTRDYLETSLTISGIPIKLVDTAGIRSSSLGPVEKVGIQRSIEKIKNADLLILLIDGSLEIPFSPTSSDDTKNMNQFELNTDLCQVVDTISSAKHKNTIVLINKWDTLNPSWSEPAEVKESSDSEKTNETTEAGETGFYPVFNEQLKETLMHTIQNKINQTLPTHATEKADNNKINQSIGADSTGKEKKEESLSGMVTLSVKSGVGLDQLKLLMEEQVEKLYPHTSGIIMASWQDEILRKIDHILTESITLLKKREYEEIIASNLQDALDWFSQLTGEITNEDLLGRIFSRFCIGK